MKFETTVISAFPCTGKSYIVKEQGELIDLTTGKKFAIDSDSSSFSWVIDGEGKKVRNSEFPNNYITHIKNVMDKYRYVFVSTHESVRNALDENNIAYTLVYPDRSLLAEYVGRAYIRQEQCGKVVFPLNVLIDNWDTWNAQMVLASKTHPSLVLRHNEYLSYYIMGR